MDIRLTLDMVRAWVMNQVQDRRREDSDRGDVPGWVIVVAITVVMAIAIGVIITRKVTDKANNINLQ